MFYLAAELIIPTVTMIVVAELDNDKSARPDFLISKTRVIDTNTRNDERNNDIIIIKPTNKRKRSFILTLTSVLSRWIYIWLLLLLLLIQHWGVLEVEAIPPTVTLSPSRLPTQSPSQVHTLNPTASTLPTSWPTKIVMPSFNPSFTPSLTPSVMPSFTPSQVPSKAPTHIPSYSPTVSPSKVPSVSPTLSPSRSPTATPSAAHTITTTAAPSHVPSATPSCLQTAIPSYSSSAQPTTDDPSFSPSQLPTVSPSQSPSVTPSCVPSTPPSLSPSIQPSIQPSQNPSTSPSAAPSMVPSTIEPSQNPSVSPTISPSCNPSYMPSAIPSISPSTLPTAVPSHLPSTNPSFSPSTSPSFLPTYTPSAQPSMTPSVSPTCSPSCVPSTTPTKTPSTLPTAMPSITPSQHPTMTPSAVPSQQPSVSPSQAPSQIPSISPSQTPTVPPTISPSKVPSKTPTVGPSYQPTSLPSSPPTSSPTRTPSQQPLSTPSSQPSNCPSRQPTSRPSNQPSRQPSSKPSLQPTSSPSSQPTRQPSSRPSSQPSQLPSNQPTRQPSYQPYSNPTNRPTNQPSSRPSRQPSGHPTSQPSSHPSRQPSIQPSSRPSRQPSNNPTKQPSSQPSAQPSNVPVLAPTGMPSVSPSRQPSVQPSQRPSSLPSRQPSSRPSKQPSRHPSRQPSQQPSNQPSMQPSAQPSTQPSVHPSNRPSKCPTVQPSARPSLQPTGRPTKQPTSQPSHQPSKRPTLIPTGQPTSHPSRLPSGVPSLQPSSHPSTQPTSKPTQQPSTKPSRQPSSHPSIQPSSKPSRQPSGHPSSKPSQQPSSQPTLQPSSQPSSKPSAQPSSAPSKQPSTQPSSQPSTRPTNQPTRRPSSQPSNRPSIQPSSQPSIRPSMQPSSRPSIQPSCQPSSQPSACPTSQPMRHPTSQPSNHPSIQPTVQPSNRPSMQPTSHPSMQPTTQPSNHPSLQPSSQPSSKPSQQPSMQPSRRPSTQPSSLPTMQPSSQPTSKPSSQPSSKPTMQPSQQPTTRPSTQPSFQPTGQPSSQPISHPSSQPSAQPSNQPSVQPSAQPLDQPSSQPSKQPSSFPTRQPSSIPSSQPSRQPSNQPSEQPSSRPSSQPSVRPTSYSTSQPSSQPSQQPSRRPSIQPTSHPSSQPSKQPILVPTNRPTCQPSRQPSTQPSSRPSLQPTSQPSLHPSLQPTSFPSTQPSSQPTIKPSMQPSTRPSTQPQARPTSLPSRQPSSQPSRRPSMQPSSHPSMEPSTQPSAIPSLQPSTQPSKSPTSQPSSQPSKKSSSFPTSSPSDQPTSNPSIQPSRQPSSIPSQQPFSLPTTQPSIQPSSRPSMQPASIPSNQPSGQPSSQPSIQPFSAPSGKPSIVPSSHPSRQPSTQPSSRPSGQPSIHPTMQPSCQPSSKPSDQPSNQPSSRPTIQPSNRPTQQPSTQPSGKPSQRPISVPTMQPSRQPSSCPSRQPSTHPTVQPSTQPSAHPSMQPSTQPTNNPSQQPLSIPTRQPSGQPSNHPSSQPSSHPSQQPSSQPSSNPSDQPSSQPSNQPSSLPTRQPSSIPSSQPSQRPSNQPSMQPSSTPSSQPSSQPTNPTSQPSKQPSNIPSSQPIAFPTAFPTMQPSSLPTRQPSMQPTMQPSSQPSTAPSTQLLVEYVNISSITMHAKTNYTATLAVRLSKNQNVIVYCGAFSGNRSVTGPVSETEIVNQGFSTIAFLQNVLVSLTSLTASTRYRFYCVTRSLTGNTMPLRVALNSVLVDTTGCCKIMTITTLKNTIIGTTNSLDNAISISLDTTPTFTLAVTLSAMNISVFAIVPFSITFKPTSFPLSTSAFSVFALGIAGSSSLSTILRGSSASEYIIRYVGGAMTVQSVESSTVALDAPKVQEIIFSSDGLSIFVSFNIATNRGGFVNYFTCNTLLSFAAVNTAGVTCRWSDDFTIVISPTTSLLIGMNVTVLSSPFSPIKLSCAISSCNANSLTQVTFSVKAPTSPDLPVVIFNAPDLIASCANLTLDISPSTGFAARVWTSYTFTVISSRNRFDYALESYLGQLNNSASFNKFVIPSHFFIPATTYTIQLTLCNFFGACGSGSHTVIVGNVTDSVIEAQILGPSSYTINAKDTISVQASASVTACSRNVLITSAAVQYNWQVLNANGSLIHNIASSSQNPAVLSLPSYTLQAGFTYIARIAASSVGVSAASRSISIIVVNDEVIASITGGTAQTLISDRSLTIDASASQDLNIVQSSVGLSYQWSCFQVLPIFNASYCPFRFARLSGATFLVDTTLYEVSRVNITADYHHINVTGRLQVIVTSTGSSQRSSIASVDVTVRDNPIVANLATLGLSWGSVNSFDVKQKLVVKAEVEVLQACEKVSWAVNDPSIDLRNISSTPISTAISSSFIGKFATLFLAISPSTLPTNALLAFSLDVSSESCLFSNHGYNILTIATNQPPTPGLFAVSPMNGVERSTVFQLTALLWTDENLPLSYDMGYTDVATASVITFRSRSVLSSASSTLPAGAVENAYALNMQLTVYDYLGASDSASTAIIVTAARAAITTLECNPTFSLDLESSRSSLSQVGSTLSAVNCSGMVGRCELDYNRQPCASVTQACGSCLSGYLGETGAANSPCVTISDGLDAVEVGRNSTTSPRTCRNTNDCKNAWLTCSRRIHQCEIISKSCPQSCSDNGQCLYESTDSGLPLSTCLITDASCVTKCSCTDGYYGTICEYSASEWAQRQQCASSSLVVLSNLTKADDISTATVPTWSQILLALTLNPMQMKLNDASTALTIAQNILTFYDNSDLSVLNSDIVLQALQTIDGIAGVSTFSELQNSSSVVIAVNNSVVSSRGLMNVASQACKLLQKIQTYGENTSYVRLANVECHTSTFALGFDNLVTNLSSSLSNYQQLTATTQPQLPIVQMIGKNDTTENNIFSSTLITLPTKVYRNHRDLNANPLFFHLNHLASSTGLSASNDRQALAAVIDRFGWTIPTANGPLGKFTEDFIARNLTTVCTNVNSNRSYEFICPDSGTVLEHSCSVRGPGVYLSYCPRPIPSCASVDGLTSTGLEEFSPVSTCHLESYSPNQTVCNCSFATGLANNFTVDSNYYYYGTSPHARKLAATVSTPTIARYLLSDSNDVEFVIGNDYQDYRFADTFTSTATAVNPASVTWIMGVVFIPSFILLIAFSTVFTRYYRARNVAIKSKSKSLKNKKNGSPGKVFVEPGLNIETSSPPAMALPEFNVQKFCEEYMIMLQLLIPSVYTVPSLWTRIKNEMKKHHDWCILFQGKSDEDWTDTWQKVAALLRLLTSSLCALLVVIACIQGQHSYRSDLCSHQTTRNQCQHVSSLFDNQVGVCQWTLQNPDVTILRPTVLNPVVFTYVCTNKTSPELLSAFAYCTIGAIALLAAIIVGCFADGLLSIMASSLLVSMIDERPRPPPSTVVVKSNNNRKQRVARLLEPRLRSLITCLESAASRELEERHKPLQPLQLPKSPLPVKGSPLLNMMGTIDTRSFSGSPVFGRPTSLRPGSAKQVLSQRPISARSLSIRVASVSARPATAGGISVKDPASPLNTAARNISSASEKSFDWDSDVDIGAVLDALKVDKATIHLLVEQDMKLLSTEAQKAVTVLRWVMEHPLLRETLSEASFHELQQFLTHFQSHWQPLLIENERSNRDLQKSLSQNHYQVIVLQRLVAWSTYATTVEILLQAQQDMLGRETDPVLHIFRAKLSAEFPVLRRYPRWIVKTAVITLIGINIFMFAYCLVLLQKQDREELQAIIACLAVVLGLAWLIVESLTVLMAQVMLPTLIALQVQFMVKKAKRWWANGLKQLFESEDDEGSEFGHVVISNNSHTIKDDSQLSSLVTHAFNPTHVLFASKQLANESIEQGMSSIASSLVLGYQDVMPSLPWTRRVHGVENERRERLRRQILPVLSLQAISSSNAFVIPVAHEQQMIAVDQEQGSNNQLDIIHDEPATLEQHHDDDDAIHDDEDGLFRVEIVACQNFLRFVHRSFQMGARFTDYLTGEIIRLLYWGLIAVAAYMMQSWVMKCSISLLVIGFLLLMGRTIDDNNSFEYINIWIALAVISSAIISMILFAPRYIHVEYLDLRAEPTMRFNPTNEQDGEKEDAMFPKSNFTAQEMGVLQRLYRNGQAQLEANGQLESAVPPPSIIQHDEEKEYEEDFMMNDDDPGDEYRIDVRSPSPSPYKGMIEGDLEAGSPLPIPAVGNSSSVRMPRPPSARSQFPVVVALANAGLLDHPLGWGGRNSSFAAQDSNDYNGNMSMRSGPVTATNLMPPLSPVMMMDGSPSSPESQKFMAQSIATPSSRVESVLARANSLLAESASSRGGPIGRPTSGRGLRTVSFLRPSFSNDTEVEAAAAISQTVVPLVAEEQQALLIRRPNSAAVLGSSNNNSIFHNSIENVIIATRPDSAPSLPNHPHTKHHRHRHNHEQEEPHKLDEDLGHVEYDNDDDDDEVASDDDSFDWDDFHFPPALMLNSRNPAMVSEQQLLGGEGEVEEEKRSK